MKYWNWFKDLKKQYQVGIIILGIVVVMYFVGLL